ncbi:NUDIX hydrolase [Kitasatospora sp. NA04385]|uniref:NUDIX domain-containing protein n=1 Tax=Kitasatospora sp. NA04385 TaxID=2742135 RepID=UPI00159132DE|nr:NUDIX hydrolase [Kitasatospora sp. NA04385]QKW18445.1 NUDIX hydrolase [Kitasatospora sp. NA04385]
MASPAGHLVTSRVLCTDPGSRLLIVRAAVAAAVTGAGTGAGFGGWQLPGGAVAEDESPLDAVRREVREGLGLVLDLLPDDLLGVEWTRAGAGGPGERAGLVFLWRGPVLSSAETDRIVLAEGARAAWRWAAPEEARRLLPVGAGDRARSRLQWPGTVGYQEVRHPVAVAGVAAGLGKAAGPPGCPRA